MIPPFPALPADDAAIGERLAKAAVYFNEKITALLCPCLETFSLETDNKEIRKQITDTVKHLKEETAVKLSGILSCREGFSPGRYLRALSTAAMDTSQEKPKAPVITYAKEDVGHPELFEALREWRKHTAADEGLAHYQVIHQKTLVQIAVRLPTTIADLKKIKGIGKRLAEKYGHALTAIVSDYCRKHNIDPVDLPETAVIAPSRKSDAKAKVDTKKVSLEYFENGMTIPQIAAQRGLTISTIESHMEYFVSKGEVNLTGIITDAKRHTIEEKITQLQVRSMKKLKAALGDDCSYGEIKLVLAHLKQCDPQ